MPDAGAAACAWDVAWRTFFHAQRRKRLLKRKRERAFVPSTRSQLSAAAPVLFPNTRHSKPARNRNAELQHAQSSTSRSSTNKPKLATSAIPSQWRFLTTQLRRRRRPAISAKMSKFRISKLQKTASQTCSSRLQWIFLLWPAGTRASTSTKSAAAA